MPVGRIGSAYPIPPEVLARRHRPAFAAAPPVTPVPSAPTANGDGATTAVSRAMGRRAAQEHIRQWYGGGLTGGLGSYGGIGYGRNQSGNTVELHRLYEEMAFREAVVKAALQRCADSVASQTLQVIPADKKNQRDRDIADAYREALLEASGGLGHGPTGLPAIVDELVLPARIHGLNVVEAPLKDRPEDRGKLRGKLGIRKFAAKRIGTYQLRYSDFGEITGVRPALMGTAGDEGYIDPCEFIIYPYLSLYGTTHSELWPAQRGYDLKENAYRLRFFYLDKLAGGAIFVNGVAADRFEAMKAALAEFRSCGFIVMEKGEEMGSIDLAMGSQEAFDAAMQYADRDMLTGVDGGHLHIQEGKTGNVAGNSSVQAKAGPELKDWRVASAVASLLTVFGRRWIDVNFRGAEYPRVKLGDIDPQATKAEADIAAAIKALGYEPDPEQIEERLGWTIVGKTPPPPAAPPAAPGQQPGQGGDSNVPGGGGAGSGQGGQGQQDQWAWEEIPAGPAH